MTLSCLFLFSCTNNQDLSQNPEQKELTQVEIEDIAYTAVESASYQIIDQAIEDMEHRFSKLSQEQIDKIKDTVMDLSGTKAKDTAQNIANSVTSQAIADMEKEFENFAEVQIQVIKSATIEIASQVAENTAKDLITRANQKAIKDMGVQFSELSQEQKLIAKETATQVAKSTARETAQAVVNKATQQAIENVENTAKNIAKDTAWNVANQTSQKAIETLENQFSELSQEQKLIAQGQATQVAKAIESMENKFSELSQEQKLIAQGQATQVAKAIEDIENKFSDFSELQIQIIKTATLEIATQIAKNTAKQETDQAIENMENQFLELSETQAHQVTQNTTQIAKETAETIAKPIAENTARNVAHQETQQFTENMRREFFDFSEEQIQIIQANILKTAERTAREVADKTLEELVRQNTFLATDQAIQEMKYRQAELLKAGLQTIISTAVESVASAVLNTVEEEDKSLVITAATNSTIKAAKEVVAELEEDNSHSSNGPSLDLFFEQCNWQNQEYTTRIIRDHNFFPLSDSLQQIVNSWDQEENEEEIESTKQCHGQTCNTDLSPLYNEVILSWFQESIRGNDFSTNDIPLECFFAGAVRGANIYDPGSHFYYCEKDSNKKSSHMSVTDNNNKERNILPRRACLNKDYTYLTATAFNKTADCFGFKKAEKEALFKLLNHESTFLHNIKSPTGAKCYGQLTTIAIEEINKQIYFRDSSNPLPYSYIFDDVIKKCPGLQHVILNSKIYEAQAKGEEKSLNQFDQIISQSPISCKITQNPYSCLFYTFYNFKKSFDLIDRQINLPTSNFSEQNNISQDFQEYFLLPIRLNTMLSVTNSRDQEMLFWDDSEIWNSSVRQVPLDSFKDIEPLPLFENDKEIQRLFSIWSYNGGLSISETYLTKFIKQLKRYIARPCNTNAQTKYCQYRFLVMDRQGIPTEDIREDFKDYIQNNYQIDKVSNGRRKEVTEFTNHVETNLNYLYDKNGRFRLHLKNMVPELDSQDIESFQDHLIQVCPKS